MQFTLKEILESSLLVRFLLKVIKVLKIAFLILSLYSVTNIAECEIYRLLVSLITVVNINEILNESKILSDICAFSIIRRFLYDLSLFDVTNIQRAMFSKIFIVFCIVVFIPHSCVLKAAALIQVLLCGLRRTR